MTGEPAPAVCIGKIRGWALGLLGMSREQFYLMRPGEFFEALEAHRQEKEDDRVHMGELVRGAVLRIYNSERKPQNQILDPAKFWRMPWDDPADAEDKEIKRLSELDEKARQAEVDNFLKRIRKDGTRCGQHEG